MKVGFGDLLNEDGKSSMGADKALPQLSSDTDNCDNEIVAMVKGFMEKKRKHYALKDVLDQLEKEIERSRMEYAMRRDELQDMNRYLAVEKEILLGKIFKIWEPL